MNLARPVAPFFGTAFGARSGCGASLNADSKVRNKCFAESVLAGATSSFAAGAGMTCRDELNEN
jgi:hypothetical protein